nr:ABC transporter ATP-binding protein [Synergistaceae bacterium]
GGLFTLFLSTMASHTAAFRILYVLRVRLAEHVGKLHLGYLTSTSTGAVKKTLEQNVEKIELFIAHQIPDFVNVVATVAILFFIMFSMNFWMALATIGAVILGFLIQSSMMFGTRANTMMKAYYDSLERINASAIQYVRGMSAVKIFGRTVFSFRKFHRDIQEYSDMVTRFTDQFQTGFVLFRTVLVSLLAFVLPVGVLLLSRDPHNVALGLTVIFFLILAPGASAPLYKIMYLSATMRDINEGVSRIDAIFRQPPVKEPENPRKPSRYDVTFEKVSFSYNAPETSTRIAALSEVSFSAPQGAVTALVGPSGSGKSTAANLIPRFWDVDQGAIRIGGVDIRDMATEDLMDTVSFVFQDTFLFYDSLYENIRVGRPEATPEEVYAAAKAAQCHDFISRLPKGYDTPIGQGGVYLSGGEEQRVSVARAILKNAPVLVLDEATAFADPENEHHMQQALKELIRNKTVIVIAHRLHSIREARNIVVLSEGKVAEEGSHEELLRREGLYKKMWEIYSDTAAWSFRKKERVA